MARALKPKLLARCLLWVATSALAAVACANPSADYESFQARTNGVRGIAQTGPQSHDGGTACTAALAGAAPDYSASGVPNADGLYFASCLANLSECDLEKTLRFRVEVSGIETGTVTIKATSLVVGATTVAQTVGDAYSASGAVKPDGTYLAIFTSGVIPGSANSISQRDIALVNVVFRGYVLTSSALCNEMDGTIQVKGVSDIDLNAPGDICRFTKVATESQPVTHVLTDYHCPLAILAGGGRHVDATLIVRSGRRFPPTAGTKDCL